MQLAPQVQQWLEQLQASGAPAMNTLSVEAARGAYRQLSAQFGGPSLEIGSVETLTAAGPAGDIPLRRYRPVGLDLAHPPTLLYFHGGGWVIGDLDSHDKVCRQIAVNSGCQVLSVGYRLAPEYPAPAAAVDAIAALIWIVDHADEAGIDPARMAVAGDSAGGSLAAVTAIAARDANIALCCQVLIYPSTDNRVTAWHYPSREANSEIPPLTREVMQYFLERYLPDASLAEDWRVSPLLVADVAGLAPLLLLTGSCDALHDEGAMYADRLERNNVEVVRRNFPGMIHGFIELGGVLSATADAMETIDLMLRQRLLGGAMRFNTDLAAL